MRSAIKTSVASSRHFISTYTYVADKESLNEQTQTLDMRHLRLAQQLSRTVKSAAVRSSVVTRDAIRLVVSVVAACATAVVLLCAVSLFVTRLKAEEAAFYFEQMIDAQVVHGISYLLWNPEIPCCPAGEPFCRNLKLCASL